MYWEDTLFLEILSTWLSQEVSKRLVRGLELEPQYTVLHL